MKQKWFSLLGLVVMLTLVMAMMACGSDNDDDNGSSTTELSYANLVGTWVVTDVSATYTDNTGKTEEDDEFVTVGDSWLITSNSTGGTMTWVEHGTDGSNYPNDTWTFVITDGKIKILNASISDSDDFTINSFDVISFTASKFEFRFTYTDIEYYNGEQDIETGTVYCKCVKTQ